MDKNKLVSDLGKEWELTYLRRELAEANDKIIELVKQVGQLKKALRPFAEEATQWVNYPDDEPVVEAFPGYEGELTVADLRFAYVVMLDLVKVYEQSKKDIEELK